MPSKANKSLAVIAAAVALLAASCGSGDDGSEAAVAPSPPTQAPSPATPAPPPQTPAPPPETAATSTGISPIYDAYRSAPTACDASQPDPATLMSFDTHEDQGLDPAVPVVVVIETSCGDIEVELDPALAPLTVNSFVFLAQQGFFDGTVSHRVMPGFMFQAGDPTATGAGDAGYDVEKDEFPPPGFRYERGVVAMANAGPGTTGSQFFIMLGNSGLPPNYTVIGRVTAGDEVLDAIAAIPIASNSRGEVSVPLEALYLERVRIAGSP